MMMAVRRCCPSSLVLLLLLVSSSSSSSFQNVFGQRWSFSLLRHRELKRDETVVKCVDKDQAVDNAASDDDTVFCNSTEGVYDVSRLDPTTPPKRCVNWTSDMINLGALHPLAICIQWHTLYGIHSTNYQEEEQSTRAPTTVISPPSTPDAPITTATTAPTPLPSPSPSPTNAPTQSTTKDSSTTTPANEEVEEGDDEAIQSIQLEEFTIRLVVPSVARRLQSSSEGVVPYDRNVLRELTQDHFHHYLEQELNRDIIAVTLDYVTAAPIMTLIPKTSLLTSQERMHGSVQIQKTNATPSQRTVNSLALQSLEGQALWEFFFRLRECQDDVLQKAQEVVLAKDGDTTTNTSSDEDTSVLSTGVTVTLILIGLLAVALVVYMIVWVRKQQRPKGKGNKNTSGTPDTQASGQFFPPDMSGEESGSMCAVPNSDAFSVHSGSISFVSSALHSIRERSLEDEEEEPDDDLEQPSQGGLWGDETGSEIEACEEPIVLENMPQCTNNTSSMEEDTTTDDSYMWSGRIQKIMRLESPYSTDQGTEVTQRNIPIHTHSRTSSLSSRPKTTRRKIRHFQKKPSNKKQWAKGGGSGGNAAAPPRKNRPSEDAFTCSF